MSRPVRILLLADTHLGFDLPVRPRVRRRRRGHDFQANYETALRPALAGEVDVVVHGGDLFHRSRVPRSLAHQALSPLVAVAETGVPVVLVPGNHERSRIPHADLAAHPRIHVFDRPRTFEVEVRGERLALAGFPFQRRSVRERFPELVARTGWRPGRAAADLLCVHQAVEGATVGPSDFTFRSGEDVIRGRDLPAGLTAVLSGHIHRHQVLTADLRDRPLAAPVVYPGSVERTSVAEASETKGYVVLEVPADGSPEELRRRFHPLPARPMLVRDLEVGGLTAGEVRRALRTLVADVPADAVLRIRVRGRPASPGAARPLSAARLRALAPPEMNVGIRRVDGARPVRRQRERPAAQHALDL